MKKLKFTLLLSSLILFTSIDRTMIAQNLAYPKAMKVDQVDEYHGIKIRDPYRWMEDVGNDAVQKWMKAQDQLLTDYLEDPEVYNRILSTVNSFGKTGDRPTIPVKGGDHYFYSLSKPRIQHRLVFQRRGLDGQDELLFDFNEIFEGKNMNTWGYTVSPSGKYFSYWASEDQSRWGKVYVFDVQNKRLLKEEIPGTSSSNIFWTENGRGFYYIHFGEESILQKGEVRTAIKYHEIGTSATNDLVVFAPENKPSMLYGVGMNSSNDMLVVQPLDGRSDQNDVYLVDPKNDHKSQELVKGSEHKLNFIGSRGDLYYFYSNENAKNGKVISINLKNPSSSKWKTIIPNQDWVLAGGSTAGGNGMNLIGDKLVLLYRYGTQQEIRVFDLDGNLEKSHNLTTGWIGSGIIGDSQGNEVFYTMDAFLDPSNVYRIDLATGENKPFFKRKLPIDPNDYVIKNIYYPSKDGTKVPLYIAHKKGLKMDGNNPLFMYAYGFGGWVAVPWYQPEKLAWLEMGGIYVLPGVRGGGEFGDAWKEAGIKHNRQTAIDDYIAAAEYLVEEGYTSPGKIVANGWSASGSLAATVCMQRPGLFGAGMIGIPSLDLLRYTEYTPFKGWTGGYGDPKVKEDFQVLYKWSPYHNIKAGTVYPPMIITAGEKDPTTPPQHAYKFAAALQAHQSLNENPVLLKIVWGGGHGFGTNNEQSRETQTQELYFLSKVLGIDVKRKLSSVIARKTGK